MNKLPKKDLQVLETICQTIFDKKGFNIMTLDVRGSSTLTDYFIIAEGNVSKHVQSLAKEITEALHAEGRSPLHIEGQKDGDWVVLDFSDIVIHLFVPDMREKYELEQLWTEAEIVDVPIHTHMASCK